MSPKNQARKTPTLEALDRTDAEAGRRGDDEGDRPNRIRQRTRGRPTG